MTRLLQRIVLPAFLDDEILPLYADGAVRAAGRTSLSVAPEGTASLGTYFSAIAIGYWRHWGGIRSVSFRALAAGEGELVVLRSDATGAAREIASLPIDGEAPLRVDVDIEDADAGGWAWVELRAGSSELELRDAGWWSDELDEGGVGTVSVGITTLDRTDYCLGVLRALASDPVVLEVVDRIHVIDQGRNRIADADGFSEVAEELGELLHVVEQPNLGGSGGFARGMLETLDEGASRYVLILDDDVRLEPESIRRLAVFGDAQGGSAIVGAHMLDLGAPTVLHAFAEGIDRDDFFWRARSPERHDLASAPLRDTAWLHRRHDADYTGWWMCLIPTGVIREIGLSAPFFIKWDDAEFSLRAAESGHPTISLPGAAIWHVAWLDKGDSRDWQAFFHTRNRMLSALLHSNSDGRRVLADALQLDLRDLVTHRYSVAAMRIAAYASVLTRPERLHAELATRRSAIVASLAGWSDARPWDGELPRTAPAQDVRADPPRGARLALWLARALGRDVIAPSPSPTRAAVRYTAPEARWWEVGRHDSVVVDAPDGAYWYRRNRRDFLRLLVRGARLRRRLRRSWPRLRDALRAEFPHLVSTERWRATLTGEDPRGG